MTSVGLYLSVFVIHYRISVIYLYWYDYPSISVILVPSISVIYYTEFIPATLMPLVRSVRVNFVAVLVTV